MAFILVFAVDLFFGSCDLATNLVTEGQLWFLEFKHLGSLIYLVFSNHPTIHPLRQQPKKILIKIVETQ